MFHEIMYLIGWAK